MKAPSAETYSKSTQETRRWKVHSVGYKRCCWQHGFSFSCCFIPNLRNSL